MQKGEWKDGGKEGTGRYGASWKPFRFRCLCQLVTRLWDAPGFQLQFLYQFRFFFFFFHFLFHLISLGAGGWSVTILIYTFGNDGKERCRIMCFPPLNGWSMTWEVFSKSYANG